METAIRPRCSVTINGRTFEGNGRWAVAAYPRRDLRPEIVAQAVREKPAWLEEWRRQEGVASGRLRPEHGLHVRDARTFLALYPAAESYVAARLEVYEARLARAWPPAWSVRGWRHTRDAARRQLDDHDYFLRPVRAGSTVDLVPPVGGPNP